MSSTVKQRRLIQWVNRVMRPCRYMSTRCGRRERWAKSTIRSSLMTCFGFPEALTIRGPVPSALFGYEFQSNTIHAVAQAGRRRAIVKDMAEMPATTPAMHLGAFHEKTPVGFGAHGTIYRAPETRPACPALEFGFRFEERQFAARAGEDSLAMLVNERAAEG